MVTATPGIWELESLQVSAGTDVIATATVRLKNSQTGEVKIDAATGDGPVDAAYSAVQRITGVTVKLTDYSLRAITGGKDAQGEVTVEVQVNGRRVRGRGVSTDIVVASARGYVSAINRTLTLETNGGERPRQP
jgi:2-isopropylmalate synthase